MSVLEVKGLVYAIGEKVLYENANFQLNKGEHMGIIGQNGVGKTTLINILIGNQEFNGGDVKWQKDIKIGYLDQHAHIQTDISIFDFLKKAFDHLFIVEKQLGEAYEEMATNSSDELSNKIEELQNKLMYSGFYDIEPTILKIASGLGVVQLGMDTLLSHLSGGQRAKVILTKLLLENPEVLLMDEPTNFLDKEHVNWLKTYLRDYEGTFIVISHDFEFLDFITNCIIDIEFKKIIKYTGSFTQAIKLKQINKETYEKNFEKQKEEIAHLQQFINKFGAGTRASMAQSRKKQLEKMDVMEPPKNLQKPNFKFVSIPLGSHNDMLIVEDLTVGYTHPLLKNISFTIGSGEKIVITGFNGIGKSTLLKTLIGQIPMISGKFKFEYHVQYGYFEQDLKWNDTSVRPFDIIKDNFPDMEDGEIYGKLAQCGVKGKLANQSIASLSGGEQCKVKLCILMINKNNLLILDEPTNHLDAEAKEVLKEELINWKGGILLVSHEEAFYKDWVNRVIPINKK